jgi:4-amino-4-deoxy-L-arabinose transferase-like glycosyltransferase
MNAENPLRSDPPVTASGARKRISPSVIALCSILALAFFLRVYGLRFGLPHLYYWDEPTVVNRAVRFGSGDLNPHDFYYPALYMYVLFLVSGVYFAIGRVFGWFHGARDFALTYFVDPTGVYHAARLTTAVVGTAAVLLTYYVGKRYFSPKVGLFAALLLAVSPLHASHSHIAITDVPHAAFVALAMLPLHDVLTRGRRRDYVLSGLAVGLGAATKYLAGLHTATLIVAHVLREWHPPPEGVRLRRLVSSEIVLGLCAVGAGFFIGAPYNVLSFQDFLRDFRAQSKLSRGNGALDWMLLHTLPLDLGWIACGLALLGLIYMLVKPSKSTLVFFTFPVVYGAAMMPIHRSFSRYLLPQLPFIVTAAGYGWSKSSDWVAARLPRAAVIPASFAVAIAALAMPAWRALSWDRLMAEEVDTRTAALEWTERSVPAGTRVVIQSLYNRTFDNLPLVTDATLTRLRRILPTGGSMGAIRDDVLRAWQSGPVYQDVGWESGPRIVTTSGVRYAFLTDVYGPPPEELRVWLDGKPVVARFAPDFPPSLRALGGDVVFLPALPPTITVYAIPE